MKITIVYENGTSSPDTHTLNYTPTDPGEAQHMAKRISLEGFYIQVDPVIGYFIPPARVIRVLIKDNLLGVVGGTGLSE